MTSSRPRLGSSRPHETAYQPTAARPLFCFRRRARLERTKLLVVGLCLSALSSCRGVGHAPSKTPGQLKSSESGSRGRKAASTSGGAGPAARSPRTHVVRAGENAFRIAMRYGVTVDDLGRRNHLDDPTKLREGQRLVIPEVPGTRTGSAARGAEAEDEDDATRLDCGAIRRSEPVEEPVAGRFLWPVDGVVVSKFGHVESQRHDGIDIAAPLGTPIRAAARGRVRYAGFQEGYGEIVIVEHGHDRMTIYAHNSKNCVSAGDVISAGDLVALVGQSGGANSPVVHFEVREGLKVVNPRRFLP